MSFLPANFEVPSKSSQFMKLEQGQNKFRIVSNLVEGYVVFCEDNKPRRKKILRDEHSNILRESKFTNDELEVIKARKRKESEIFEEPKYFWLCVVYNYKTGSFQALEITQKSIITSMTEYLKQDDWADPSQYDFVVTKKGESLNTEYSVTTSLPKPLPDEAMEQLEILQYDLDRVFQNEYPFD